MEKVFRECMETRDAGQKEYAHREDNALDNFDSEGRDLGIPRMKVWAIFAGKHWRGVRAFINGHKSQREDVRGRIKDLIVYLILLWAIIDDDEQGGLAEDERQRKINEGMQNAPRTLGSGHRGDAQFKSPDRTKQ